MEEGPTGTDKRLYESRLLSNNSTQKIRDPKKVRSESDLFQLQPPPQYITINSTLKHPPPALEGNGWTNSAPSPIVKYFNYSPPLFIVFIDCIEQRT